MRKALLPCVALGLASGLVAQVVVPSASAKTNPAYYDYMCTYGTTSTATKNEGRGQYLYDSADVGGTAVWKSISWRRPQSLGNANVATTFSMQIIMSNSPVAYNSPSSTFSANHGSKTSGTPPVTVFNGQLNLPANTKGSSWPEPWLAAIPTAVFVHLPVKGGSLVIDCIGSKNSQSKVYYCEGHRASSGQRVSNGPSGGCQNHSDGGWNNGISYRSPIIGGQWYVQHNSMPSNEPNMKRSLNLIGVQGIGGKAFGMTLAIPITKLGFLDICKNRVGVLANDVVLVQPMTYTPSTAAASRGTLRTPTVNIPNDANLGNVSFFQQPICPDKKLGNFDQIYMGWPSKWVVGGVSPYKGSTVYRLGDNSQLTGTVRNGYGRTMLLK